MLELLYRDISDFSRYSTKIGEYLSRKGVFDEETGFYVKLAITELAGNILKHSSCSAVVNLMTDRSDITINISGGNCFDYDIGGIMPECCCESGRGIVIVKNIAKSLVYKDGGKNAVCIISRQ